VEALEGFGGSRRRVNFKARRICLQDDHGMVAYTKKRALVERYGLHDPGWEATSGFFLTQEQK
jgi:hypothetical protein